MPEEKRTASQEWDDIANTRSIHSSGFAKEAYLFFTKEGIFSFDYQHEWARLAISYSMQHVEQKAPLESAPDATGVGLHFMTLFPDNSRLWVALIGQELYNKTEGETPFTREALLTEIRAHWHRGAVLLKKRYDTLKIAYEHNARDKFLQELAEQAQENLNKWQVPSNAETAQATASTQQDNQTLLIEEQHLQRAITKIAADAKIAPATEGIRYDRYLLQCQTTASCNTLTTKVGDLAISLGCKQDQLKISQAIGIPNALHLDVLRPEESWKTLGANEFSIALQTPPVGHILPICVGANWRGQAIFKDLAEAPHVLVAGTTGSGKSVCINAMIQSILDTQTPQKVQMVFIDPKRVEFMRYQQHAYIWQGVADLNSTNGVFMDDADISVVLTRLVEEMKQRYTLLEQHNGKKFRELAPAVRPAYLAVFIDELASLVVGIPEAETNLIALATQARAAGIHLILATQRPDAKTFDGQLRSNVAARIALKVQKDTESRIILDETGAEDLAGKGDRLVKWGSETTLLHGYHLA